MPVPSRVRALRRLAIALLPSILLVLTGGCDRATADSDAGGQSSSEIHGVGIGHPPSDQRGQSSSRTAVHAPRTASSPDHERGQSPETAEHERGQSPEGGQSSTPLAAPEPTLASNHAAPSLSDRPAADLPDPPRIAALAPFAVDLLLELGITPVAAPRLVGGSLPRWGDIALITVEHGAGPNPEELLAAAPEIIVASSDIAHAVTALAPVHRARVVIMDVTSLDELTAHATTLATLAGRPSAAAPVTERLARDGAALPTEAPVDVLAIFGTAHSFFAFLPDSYLGDLIDRSGGRLVTADLESHPMFTGLAPLTMESIVARAPERIIVIFHGSAESVLTTLRRDPAWSTLDAVRAGRVTTIPDDLVILSPGVNVPDALRLVRDALHAE